MPTSNGDRYAQLLQNLAVSLGAIREAIAAERPRPAPLTDDKRTTRTHFVYRIDIWTDDGKNILEHLAGIENLIVARAAYRAACERWPNARITLRQGGRIVEDSRR
jgi:hypothetical protein